MENYILSRPVIQAAVGKLTAWQLQTRRSWSAVPDDQNILASMHVVHCVPLGSTTVTTLNPTDPGTLPDSDSPAWLVRPGLHGRLLKAGRP